MPYNWVKVGSSSARQRRDEIREACRKDDVARLCENQIYYDKAGEPGYYALIEVRKADAFERLVQSLKWTVVHELEDADEKDGPLPGAEA
jgi:hypothetical protein